MAGPKPGGMPFAQPPAPPVPAQPEQQGAQQSPFFMEAMQALQAALEHHQHLTAVHKLMRPHMQPGTHTAPKHESPAGDHQLNRAMNGSDQKPLDPMAVFSARNMPGRNALAASSGHGNPPHGTKVW